MLRAFIIGNGLSLWQTHPERIPPLSIATFGTNLLPKLYSFTDWRPYSYVACSTAIDVPEYRDIVVRGLMECDRPIMTPEVYRSLTSAEQRHFTTAYIYPANADYYYWSSDPFRRPFSRWGTSSLYMMQVARYLGFNPLYLIGFDMGYKPMLADGFDPNHFVADYWGEFQQNRPKDQDWYDRMRRDHNTAHKVAKRASDQLGFDIYNCTPGGECDAYPRMSFHDAITN